MGTTTFGHLSFRRWDIGAPTVGKKCRVRAVLLTGHVPRLDSSDPANGVTFPARLAVIYHG